MCCEAKHSRYWQTVQCQQIRRVDCVPENYTNTKYFNINSGVCMFNIHAHFVFECESQEGWLQRSELSNLLLECVQQDVLPYLSWLSLFSFSFITFLLDFVWLCYSWTLRLSTHSQHRSLDPDLGVAHFLDVICCWLAVSQVSCVNVHFGKCILDPQWIQMQFVISRLQWSHAYLCYIHVQTCANNTFFLFWKCSDVFDSQGNCSPLENVCQCCVD